MKKRSRAHPPQHHNICFHTLPFIRNKQTRHNVLISELREQVLTFITSITLRQSRASCFLWLLWEKYMILPGRSVIIRWHT